MCPVRHIVAVVAIALAGGWLPGCQTQERTAPSGGTLAPTAATTTRPAEVEIDLDQAATIALPEIKEELKPTEFRTPDGRTGWVIRVPGGRPIATPAYADGLLFVGGGYGSHEFYALDAGTGTMVWKINTGDDGPSAAVVDEGCVAFNTESCTLYIIEARTGKVLWQEWLGDPLMSQPAIAHGRVYMVYPAGQRAAHNVPPQAPSANAPAAAEPSAEQTASPTSVPAGRHRLLCADLRTGRHLWEQAVTADAISAPVVEGNQVFLTCFDGTSFCIDAGDGTVVWRKENAATSAPLVAAGHVVITRKAKEAGASVEGINRLDPQAGEARESELLAAGKAPYLEANQGGGVLFAASQQAAFDSSVGFSSAPSAAGLTAANSNVGVHSVVGGWAYQGSRAAYARGQIMNAQGLNLNAIRADDGQVAWHAAARGKGFNDGTQAFSPPALGRRQMYLCTAQGHLLAIHQDDGRLGFLYATGQPMAFQPALAGGNVYVGTANGLIMCLKTGDPDADGWYAWGGNAQHNKKD